MESVFSARDRHIARQEFSLAELQLNGGETQFSFGEDGVIDPNAGPGGSYRPSKEALPEQNEKT